MFGLQYDYREGDAMCNWSMLALVARLYPSHSGYDVIGPFIVFIAVPFLLPCLPILISCVISITIISFRVRSETGNESGVKDKASKTIIMLTGIYILFNVPYWVYVCLNMLYFMGTVDLTRWLVAQHGSYFILFVTPISIIVNAAVNPLLYFSRIAPLRESVQRGTVRVRELSFRGVSGRGSARYRVAYSRKAKRCKFLEVSGGPSYSAVGQREGRVHAPTHRLSVVQRPRQSMVQRPLPPLQRPLPPLQRRATSVGSMTTNSQSSLKL